MIILEAKEITKIYTVDHRDIKVLDDVSLKVESGEFVVINGSSGNDKTTHLMHLSGLDHHSFLKPGTHWVAVGLKTRKVRRIGNYKVFLFQGHRGFV